jgi:hypothetical protein
MDSCVTRAAKILEEVEYKLEQGEESETSEESSKIRYHLWVPVEKYNRSFSREIKSMRKGDFIYYKTERSFVIRTNKGEILSTVPCISKTTERKWGILITVDKVKDETKEKLERLLQE